MSREKLGRCAALLLATVVASCTTSSGPTTTISELTSSAPPQATTTTDDPILALALPIDPDVIRGELENGLTYFVRENDSPGGRAELRLLVDAGSVQEDPDQAGMAHFLEHMMFNGTEKFPRNELIDVLESFGPRFGPDINAFTSYDETVYELGLTTEDTALIQLGIDVLREWATRATLTEDDVVAERGVIVDEWRTRAQGFDARVNEKIEGLVLPGTVYDGHDPIGTAESIEATSPAELGRFYTDWYHPQRMAVVAVGDFDATEMEAMIESAFSDIPAVQDARAWDAPPYEVPTEARAATLVDEEATMAGVTVLWPTRAQVSETVGDYQRALAASLGVGILADRLSDDASAGEGPLLGATAVDVGWTRAFSVEGVDVEVRAGSADEGLVAVLNEVERIRRDGIGEAEFDRALAAHASFSRQIYEQRESAQDLQFTDQIVGFHLTGTDLMSPGQRFDVESGILARLTTEDVETALWDIVNRPPVVLALGPDDPGIEVPGPERVFEILAGLHEVELEDRPNANAVDAELMASPEPVLPERTSVDPRFEFTTLEFGNGATVYLWESGIATGSVFGLVEGFGGSSVISVQDLPEAFLMTEIVGRSGVGEFDLPSLRRALAGRIVGVLPWITETRQGLEVDSSSEDVETLFQLLHLTLTESRFDPSAVDAVLDEMTTLNASRGDLPDLLFEEAISNAYYGDDPRYFVIPDAEQLSDFDVTVAERLFADRFGDASRLAFAFVGDFDTAEMTQLASRYIGTLPGSGVPGQFVDNQPLPIREVQVATVEAGTGVQGQIGMFFTNEFEATLVDRVAARLLELIVTARLRERIREGLSATYSISALIDLQRDPDPFAEASIVSSGDPTGLEEISTEILADLESLQTDGPTRAEFATAVEQLKDELELVDNRLLATALITAHLYPDQPVSEVADAYSTIDEITPEQVRQLTGAVFDLAQRIEVRQVPRS